MRGRIRKSNAQKIFEGNLGNRKITGEDFEVEAAYPEMTKGLSPLARREWRMLAPELVEAGRLSVLDGKALAAYCEAYAKAEAASRLIDKFGMLVPVLKMEGAKVVTTDKLRANPACTILKDYLTVLATYADMFGLSPKSRLRLRFTEKPKKSGLRELMHDAPETIGFVN